MLKAGLISCQNEKQNTKGYLRQNDTGILTMLSTRYVAKKWIGKVIKSGELNELLHQNLKIPYHQMSKDKFKR